MEIIVTPDNKKRRITDATGNQNKILELIEQENDPKDRAFLIVLQQINISLIANTSTINDIAEKLDAHLTAYKSHAEREQELFDTGRGMWKVGAWVLGIAQTIAIAAVGTLYTNLDEMKKTDSAIESRVSAYEEQCKQCQSRLNSLIQK